jgi:2,5-diketo-D-gluconate reductase A
MVVHADGLSRRALFSAVTATSLSIGYPVLPVRASHDISQPLLLPPIGLGTCCDEYDTAEAQVLAGLRAGYRLLDTAGHYDSEPAVGSAIREARARGLIGSEKDDEVRTVTKIWFDDMGFEPTLAAAKRSMANLRVDRLDTVLVHFPGTIDAIQSPAANRKLRSETWRALELLLADGRCRGIGVSNYNRRHLRETLASCKSVPSVLQTELHPRLPQSELIEYARASGVSTIMAHCPLAHGSPALLGSEVLSRLAKARGPGCTPAMLCLRWSLDRGYIPIPKASSDARLAENIGAWRSMPPLTAEERAAIDGLEAFGQDARVSFDPGLIV